MHLPQCETHVVTCSALACVLIAEAGAGDEEAAAAMVRELSRWVGAVLGARGDSQPDYEDRFDRSDRFGSPGVLLSTVLGRLRDAASRTGAQARRKPHAHMLSLRAVHSVQQRTVAGRPVRCVPLGWAMSHSAACRCGAQACQLALLAPGH